LTRRHRRRQGDGGPGRPAEPSRGAEKPPERPRYRVDLEEEEADSLRSLPKKVQGQITRRIDALAITPRPPGCEKLKGPGDLWRIRSGDYRIVYQIRDAVLLVLVVRIADRKDVYWDL
jgi:mRNA interferase RelE/StbE